MATIPKKHFFVCTSSDCRKRGGKKVCRAMKEAAREFGRRGEARVIQVKCLEQCGHGPMALVYPDGCWYSHLDERSAREAVAAHLGEGYPLRHKLYSRAHPGKKVDG
jgi:sirohydrochlorin cobaltochelatase